MAHVIKLAPIIAARREQRLPVTTSPRLFEKGVNLRVRATVSLYGTIELTEDEAETLVERLQSAIALSKAMGRP